MRIFKNIFLLIQNKIFLSTSNDKKLKRRCNNATLTIETEEDNFEIYRSIILSI